MTSGSESEKDSHPSGFFTTRWSVVLAAGRESEEERRVALEALCESYWYPVYSYVRRRGHPAEDAADLTQGLFASLLERGDFGRADPAKGRFRAFLLTCVRNFLANERDRERAQKRGGGRQALSIDGRAAEERYRFEPADENDPERLFDRAFGLTLLDTVVGKLGKEYREAGKGELFAALRPALTGSAEALSHGEIAAARDMSVEAVKVAALRLRRRFADLLRAEITETVAAPSEVEDEIRSLFQAVRR